MSQTDHWDRVYSLKRPDQLGWYESHLWTSLTWIRECGLTLDAPIIDVGGGASTLVDDLLETGYQSITVLDISEHALAVTKSRLGKKATMVSWLVGDITSLELPSDYYQLWHDRAVFHFLTEPHRQRKYRASLVKSLKRDGRLIIGTFAPEAPPTCSGLPVQRYNHEQLQNSFGAGFELRRHQKELHITPSGVEQMYLYCDFRKVA